MAAVNVVELVVCESVELDSDDAGRGRLAGGDAAAEVTGGAEGVGVEGEEEEDFEWYAEFTDFTDDSPNKKDVHKVQIRLDLEEDAWCRLKLQMDGDGEWIVPAGGRIEGGSKMSYTLAIVAKRADFYKLRLEGQGECKIYSITRQYSEGSELKSRPGRQ